MKFIFCDRDGVINDCPFGDYVKSVDELRIYPFAVRAIRRLNEAGYEVVVVSNQAGIAKQLYTHETLNEVTQAIRDAMTEGGARILAFYHCPHVTQDDCSCRKPRPGLFRMALERFADTELDRSFLIGDSFTDLQAAGAVGVRAVLVRTGHGARDEARIGQLAEPPVAVVDNLDAASRLIVNFP